MTGPPCRPPLHGGDPSCVTRGRVKQIKYAGLRIEISLGVKDDLDQLSVTMLTSSEAVLWDSKRKPGQAVEGEAETG